jgi:hypothetical protein
VNAVMWAFGGGVAAHADELVTGMGIDAALLVIAVTCPAWGTPARYMNTGT